MLFPWFCVGVRCGLWPCFWKKAQKSLGRVRDHQGLVRYSYCITRDFNSIVFPDERRNYY